MVDRLGYGASFNEIKIENNLFYKKAKNDYGKKKLINEINVYKFILINQIDFPIPKLYGISSNEICMEYLENYENFWKLKFDKNLLKKILNYLDKLHQGIKISVDPSIYRRDLLCETKDKILERKKEFQSIIDKYRFIKKVNNVVLKKYNDILNIINDEMEKFLKNNKCNYCVIHGDCQFNNIMVNGHEIKFIDPRGYFGHTQLYGLKEYDLAKICFALTGYDEFDGRDIQDLDINHDNIYIKINIISDDLFVNNKFLTCLMLSIWLANPHCFKENEYKCITSYFMGLYLASIYL